MKSKELLFELIQSLSKSEKRYFKVFTSNHKENNNYIKLFDAIHNQTKYNEDLLIEQFKDEDFVRQFSVAKNYLMNLILKSLTNHHHKAKKSIELNNFLSEIEILYWKGLYKLADKKIRQAKKIANKYDMTRYLLMINYWEWRLEDFVGESVISEDAIKTTENYLQMYNQQLQLNFLIKKMQNITKSSIKSTQESAIHAQKIFDHELMQLKEESVTNFYAKVDYLLLKGIGNSILGNVDQEFYYKKKLLDFLEENPHQIKENPLRYSSSVNNILLYYYFQGYPTEYPEYLAKLDQVELKFHHAKASFYDTKYNLEIGYYMHMDDKGKVAEALVNMEGWYENGITRKSTQAKMICEYNMALAFNYLEDRKKCLKWCNSCFSYFDMKSKNFRHDLAVSTLIVQILVYIDLEYFDLAAKRIETVIDIARANKYAKVELTIFKLIKQMIIEETTDNHLQNLKKIMDEQAVALINIDKDAIVFWLERKLI